MKAQVVATSRLAAVRYQKAITEALEELLDEVENIDPALLGLSGKERRDLRKTDPESALLATAHAHASTLRRLKAAAVISSATDDPPNWDQWSGERMTTENIREFKRPLAHADASKQSGLAFLCVCTKLLTGFDAQVEQVLYLGAQPPPGHSTGEPAVHGQRARLGRRLLQRRKPAGRGTAGLQQG